MSWHVWRAFVSNPNAWKKMAMQILDSWFIVYVIVHRIVLFKVTSVSICKTSESKAIT